MACTLVLERGSWLACARALAHTARTLTHTPARTLARTASWSARPPSTSRAWRARATSSSTTTLGTRASKGSRRARLRAPHARSSLSPTARLAALWTIVSRFAGCWRQHSAHGVVSLKGYASLERDGRFAQRAPHGGAISFRGGIPRRVSWYVVLGNVS